MPEQRKPETKSDPNPVTLHRERSGIPRDPLAVVLLEAASNYLEQRKGAQAYDCALRALELVRGDDALHGTVEVLDRLASACQLTGRRDAAEEYWLEAQALQERHGEHLGAAQTHCHLASLEKERGDLRKARALLLRSLQLSAGSPPGEVRARALEDLCPVERRLGEPESALARLSEAIRIREALGDTRQLATNHDHLGNIHLAQGRLPEAIEHYGRALELFERLELRAGIALVSNNLGIARMQRGEYDLATNGFQRARSLFADLGDERRLAWTVGNLGLLESYRGNARVAETLLLESVESLERIGDRSGQAIFMNNLAPVYRMSGRLDDAVTWARRSVALMRDLEQIEGSTQPWINLAVSELERHHLDEAEQAAREVQALAQRSESPGIQSEALILQALLSLARRDPIAAILHAREARRLAEIGDHPRERAEALRILGEAELLAGDLEAARASLQAAHAVCKTLNDAFQLALCRLQLGKLFLQVDAVEAAGRHLRLAADTFERLTHATRRWEALVFLARAEWRISPGQARATLETARELARAAGRADLLEETRIAQTELESGTVPTGGASGSLQEVSRLAAIARECAHPEEFVLRLLESVAQRQSLDWAAFDLGPTRGRITPPAFADAPVHDLELLLQTTRGTAQPQHLWLSSDDNEAVPIEGRPFAAAVPVLGLAAELIGILVVRGTETIPIAGVNPPRLFPYLRALGDLIGLVWRGLEPGRFPLRLPRDPVSEEPGAVQLYAGIVGESRAMLAVFEAIERIAPTDASVLVRGESGTGKELVARAIHDRSARRTGPFVAISCPSIPRDLIEAELFGHEKGAYTGATTKRPGQIELADGGTLFLDEVGDMDLATQTKLLRFLQEREFVPVGGRKAVRVNIRLLAATSRNLEEEVRAGRLREDLYYRINVVPIHLPALRERPQDIRPLIRYFLDRLGEREGITHPAISDGALARLSTYSWPGNVRELQNTVEYLVTLRRGEPITEDDLPRAIYEGQVGEGRSSQGGEGRSSAAWRLRPGETLETRIMSLEGAIIRETLQTCEGNQSKAARILGLKESTLRHKMRRYGISGEASRAERRQRRKTARSTRRAAPGGENATLLH